MEETVRLRPLALEGGQASFTALKSGRWEYTKQLNFEFILTIKNMLFFYINSTPPNVGLKHQHQTSKNHTLYRPRHLGAPKN